MSPIIRPIRVLLVEDDEDDFFITKELLRDCRDQEFVLDWEQDWERGLETILKREHDVYLIDFRLGAKSGFELIEKSIASGISSPFIILTGQGDATTDTNAIELGASDYLVKGEIDTPLLTRSIRYSIDRNNALTSIADSEARYRMLFEANPESMWVFGKEDLQFRAVNEAASKFLGYSKQEFLQMTVLDIRSQDEKERFLAYYETDIKACVKNPEAGAWRYICKNGQEVSAEILIHDFNFDDEECCLVLAIDITEKQKTRQALLQTENSFKKLLEDNRDALLVVSENAEVKYANPAAEKILGVVREDLEAQSFEWTDFSFNSYELEYLRPDRQSITLEVHRSQTEWERSPVSLITMRDVSARKSAEQELRILKRSLESSYNGVVVVDALEPGMPIIYANPAFERITGYSESEVIGKNCRFLQGSDIDQLKLEEIRFGLRNKKEVRVVLKNYRKDGSFFWNELFISPVFNEATGSITHFVGVQNDISDQKKYESELRYNSSHDLLTGLPNRTVFEDRLRQGCQIVQRYKRRLAVMFVDLDGFKPINDLYGHTYGDQLLIEVARRMEIQVRPGDTVSRMGGDEFIILLPDLAHDDDVVPIAERILESISKPYDVKGVELHVTACVGITLGDGHEDSPNVLVQQADLAMYKAKQEGRNNFQWYTNDLNQRVSERLSIRNELQRAIENENFEIYYQPQVSARTGRVVGIEALLRWNHPTKGVVSPALFIPIAEDTGQIVQLGSWVLDTACSQLKELERCGVQDICVAVNISPVQFQRGNFVETVKAVLAKYDVTPSRLELEVTETVLLNNTEKAIVTLNQLKDVGVAIAIDDFGTGFSSLNYLKRLPIDKVKIDRSFVQEIISDRHDAAITQGIISMAHHLRLKVIAEGVETDSQVAFLKRSHCDEFQGFFFGRPMPLPEIRSYLLEKAEAPEDAVTVNEVSPTVLLLDDEDNILKALARVLRRDRYKVLMATRAQDAFELLAKHEVQVVISDQRMPEISGTEFLQKVKDMYPSTIRIVLSGYTDLRSVTDAINRGAIYKFLTKPWEDEQLRAEIAQAFREFGSLKVDENTVRKS